MVTLRQPDGSCQQGCLKKNGQTGSFVLLDDEPCDDLEFLLSRASSDRPCLVFALGQTFEEQAVDLAFQRAGKPVVSNRLNLVEGAGSRLLNARQGSVVGPGKVRAQMALLPLFSILRLIRFSTQCGENARGNQQRICPVERLDVKEILNRIPQTEIGSQFLL